MESVAKVIRLDGLYIVLEVAPVVSGCGRCHEAGGCGSGLLNKSLRPQWLNTYRLPNLVGATVGDRVILSIQEGAVLRAALMAYLLPVLLLIAGAAVGTAFSDAELTALLGASAGLVLGVLILRLAQSRLAGSGGGFMAMQLEKMPKDFI